MNITKITCPKNEEERKKAFSVRLSELMKEKGISQEKLAETVHVSQQAVSNWIKQKNFPDIDQIMQLCQVFGCNVDCLLGRINAKTHDRHFICEETGLSEETVERLTEKKDGICKALNFILPHQYGEEVCSELSSFIDMTFRPYIEVSATQGEGDVTFLSDVDSLTVNGRSVDRDIIRQAIIVNLQWLLNSISRDAENKGLLSKGNGIREESFFFTSRVLSRLEAPNTPISE